MKNITLLLLIIICNSSCDTQPNKAATEETDAPKEMLTEAYQLFKEGKDAESVALANRVLTIGQETKNDSLIGKALTSLCRNAQRDLDTNRLADLSDQLVKLAGSSGNEKWLMYRAHQNAEMWRLIGNMDRADSFYVESMRISKATDSKGMYMIDHFNKSFVATAKGNFNEANDLIKKYYNLRIENKKAKEENNGKTIEPTDPYGLIAIAYLLEQQKNYKGAHEVAAVTRRLFKEQNLFPEPPDEKPLLAVEHKVEEILETKELAAIRHDANKLSVADVLNKYLN